MRARRPDSVERFLTLSVALTGYDRAELHATGLVGAYWDTLTRVVGGRTVGELLSAWDGVVTASGGDPEAMAAGVKADILADPDLGPLARNLVVLWYLGQWTQMPADWRGRHGASAGDLTHVVSAAAYREGLVWDAIQAHPMSAKQQGFGAWALPPRGAAGARTGLALPVAGAARTQARGGGLHGAPGHPRTGDLQ